MLRSLDSFKPKQALPRMVADWLLVQMCMIAALGISLLYHIVIGTNVTAQEIVSRFAEYYVSRFIALSFVFTLVFLLLGFYTRSRSYTSRHKSIVVLQGAFVATLVFLALNYFVFPSAVAARSVLLAFAVLTPVALASVRSIKAFVEKRVDIRSRNSASVNANEPVLIIGGAGYIGSILCRKLLEHGESVRVLDSLIYGDSAIEGLFSHPRFELITGDCRNIQSVVGAVKGARAVIHLAAIVGDPACELDHQSALEINYAATRMIVEVAKGQGISRFVFASSCSVYGAADVLMDEKSAVAPISLYGQTKIDSERAILEAATREFQPTILRLATVFGNSYRPRFDLVVNLLTAKAFREGVITIYNGQQWRPFIHVADVAEGFVSALLAPLDVVGGEVYNLGDSRLNYTLSDVAAHIQALFPDTRVEHVDNADKRNYRVSFDKIQKQVGFLCAQTVPDGILELKQAFERGEITDPSSLFFHNQRYLQTNGIPRNANEMDSHVMAAFAARLESFGPQPELAKTRAAGSGR